MQLALFDAPAREVDRISVTLQPDREDDSKLTVAISCVCRGRRPLEARESIHKAFLPNWCADVGMRLLWLANSSPAGLLVHWQALLRDTRRYGDS